MILLVYSIFFLLKEAICAASYSDDSTKFGVFWHANGIKSLKGQARSQRSRDKKNVCFVKQAIFLNYILQYLGLFWVKWKRRRIIFGRQLKLGSWFN